MINKDKTEVEKELLGNLMIYPGGFEGIRASISCLFFDDITHRKIFKIMQETYSKLGDFDFMSMQEPLKQAGGVELIKYLSDLVERTKVDTAAASSVQRTFMPYSITSLDDGLIEISQVVFGSKTSVRINRDLIDLFIEDIHTIHAQTAEKKH